VGAAVVGTLLGVGSEDGVVVGTAVGVVRLGVGVADLVCLGLGTGRGAVVVTVAG